MPVRYLSDPELARLSGWPDEIADEDAVTYFTLSAGDVSWLAGCDVRRVPKSPRAGAVGRRRAGACPGRARHPGAGEPTAPDLSPD